MVTASRCEVATHVASLVFGCKVSMSSEAFAFSAWVEVSNRCESIRRHSVFCTVEKHQQFPRFRPRERQCCPASTRSSVDVPVMQASTAFVFGPCCQLARPARARIPLVLKVFRLISHLLRALDHELQDSANQNSMRSS